MKAIIILLVLCWLPLIATAQIDTISGNPDKLLPKKLNFKGWYFGVSTGLFISGLTYTIPNDPVSGFGATGSNFLGSNSGETTDIGNRFGIQLIGKYVIGKRLTVDFTSTIVQEGGPLVLSRTVGGRGLFGITGGTKEFQIYDLDFLTHQMVVTPNLTIGPKKLQLLIGVGFGYASIYNRSSKEVEAKYPVRGRTGILNLQTGFSSHFGGGIATLKIGLVQTGGVSTGNWEASADNFSALIGYALPLSAFKKKTKTAIL